eukprot:TRINITY_DN1555_c0_g2_i3.p1 TRINITY_DN1555_c0_g2~~TRINITY_DN1555_c0_g2_i3.p1  ORF type:complete len:595 (-),score=198.35 TRINITY_DN1555_c0_g2_i3:782-2566(-)
MARPGQPTITQYFNGNSKDSAANAAGTNGTSAAPASAPAVNGTSKPPVDNDKPVDEESKKGRFAWFEIEKTYLPYIYRYTTEKFTSVRMVERKLLNKYLQVLPQEVNSCTSIRSYYLTDNESKLLNEINLKHTDCTFGKEAFTSKDLVVRLKDAKEFYRFLDLCNKKLVQKKSNASDRCGFFRINGESVVPYTVKKDIKYVPLFYFEGETDHLKLKSEEVEGWDLAYLKFCCKVQGIRSELFNNDICKVVALDEIKGHFPQGTTFEDYWPAKGSIEPVSSRSGVSGGNWTQKPPGQPVTKPATVGAGGGGGANAAVQMQPNGISSLNSLTQQQLSALSAAYRLPNVSSASQLTPTQLQQLQLQGLQGLTTQAQLQNLLRAGVLNSQTLQSLQRSNPQLAAFSNQAAVAAAALQQQQRQPGATAGGVDMAALARQQQAAAAAAAAAQSKPSGGGGTGNKTFPGKLTQIKEFPMERSNQPPYKLQKALIDQKIVPCINVRPYVFHDLMMTLPDFVKNFFPDLPLEKARDMLQEILKVVLYKGNTGHQEILRQEGKCQLYDPVPLVLVKDIMTYMPQIKYMFTSMMNEPAAKRQRVN